MTIDTVSELAYQGAGSAIAAQWTGEAAHELGDGRDRVAVLQLLADRVSSRVAFSPDEYAGEDVQPIEETLELPSGGGRAAGDCDDFTVAMLALGRRAGLRGAAMVFEELRGEDYVPVHILPAFEDPSEPGRWIPVELTKPTRFGDWPAMGEGRWMTYAMQDAYAPGIGDIFGTLVGGALSLLGIKTGGDDAKKAAKETRKGQEAIANATVQANRENAAAAERIELIQAAELERGLQFGREALGVLFKLGIAAAAVAALSALSRPAPRARAAGKAA